MRLLHALSLASVATAFTHPGLLHTESDFTRIKSKLQANAEPWQTAWYKLTNSTFASPAYTARPQETVYRGKDGTHAENYSTLYKDIAAAYALALQWKITSNATYADAGVAILDSWADTLTGIAGNSDKFLAAGIYGYEFANAAELLRDYDGWDGEKVQAFADMMVRVFYPMNRDFFVRHNDAAVDHYWANWDLCNLASMLSIGVLADNETMFAEAVDYFKNGTGNGRIDRMVWKVYEVDGQVLGQGQEAGRDQGHSMLDFGLLGPIALSAFNQGEDLFAYADNRILAGAEYAAKYNLGHDVPYTTYQNSDVTQAEISTNARGDVRPIWELLYNHYGVLKGLNATWTKQYRDMVVEQGQGAEGGGGDYGSTSGGFDQLGHGTLMYSL
ncbi:chondroitin AC/alginate lyase [Aspergillus avenaceus]|uniref:Chondroitin AC/alginate lyase n=1 Tax=Aspergillus avenaceus TaxID=36643 RepID=A0A5N6U7X3_ASPAV|nr:chondroitin AC/alginate lyase [Aspergillus avenaceus]